MQCQEKLELYLRAEGVPFEAHQHPPAFTAQEVAEREHISGKQVAKVVVVWADNQLVMLVLPASHQVDAAHLDALLGAQHVRLAHEPELAVAFPDCEVGAMPPFGNLYDLPVYVDTALSTAEMIVVAAGTHTDTLHLAYADYARLVKPNVATFAEHA